MRQEESHYTNVLMWFSQGCLWSWVQSRVGNAVPWPLYCALASPVLFVTLLCCVSGSLLCPQGCQPWDGIPSEQTDERRHLSHVAASPLPLEHLIHHLSLQRPSWCTPQQGWVCINIMEISQWPIFPIEKGIAFLRHVGKVRLIKHKTFLPGAVA